MVRMKYQWKHAGSGKPPLSFRPPARRRVAAPASGSIKAIVAAARVRSAPEDFFTVRLYAVSVFPAGNQKADWPLLS